VRLLDRYYFWLGNADLINFVLKKRLKISWVIEAGCHDGSDTLNLARYLQPQRIIAFEPDAVALKLARQNFETNGLSVEVFPFGLSNSNKILYLNYLDGREGTGSTFLSDSGTVGIHVKTLDSLNLELGAYGALWLDVEGHATQVLQGASKDISSLVIAKIEVQMHDMNEYRKADLFEVLKIMRKHGLIPIKAPIHPGFFGDVLFLHSREAKLVEKLISKFLVIQILLLHGFVYPVLGKPVQS
jgi:FkbM family methyltransferase